MAPTKKPTKTVKKPQSTEDLIMGKPAEMVEIRNLPYESAERKYRVTNLELGNAPIYVDGTVIETFIGSKNLEARKELRNGAKMVITKDTYKNIDLYKIEVIE